ncbi:MAG: STAS domain-containing protein [Candidatus Gastranaerophilales bacterium]|nr:STAS domain-containing protein [Candidatus Gastranaerophilales bacterium]
MEIKLRKQDEDTLEVVASGKIDIDSAVEYGTKISDAVEDNEIKNVILDFAQITYISSMGLRVILELHQKMSNLGTMKIKNASEQILNIFKMTGFSKFLNIV